MFVICCNPVFGAKLARFFEIFLSKKVDFNSTPAAKCAKNSPGTLHLCYNLSFEQFLSSYIIENYSLINPIVDHCVFVEAKVHTIKKLFAAWKEFELKVWASNVINFNPKFKENSLKNLLKDIAERENVHLTEEELLVGLKELNKVLREFKFFPEYFCEVSEQLIGYYKKGLL